MLRLALVAVVLVLPSASAEGELAMTIAYEEKPFTLAEQRAEISVDVDCAVFSGVPPQIRVALDVEVAPFWLTATPDPHELFATPTDCPGARTTLTSILKMFKHPTDTEPIADVPFTFAVRATTQDARGNPFEATASLVVRAGVSGFPVRVRADDHAPFSPRPGDEVIWNVVVENPRNTAALVAWTPDDRATALAVQTQDVRVMPGEDETVAFRFRVPIGHEGPLEFDVRWNATRESPAREVLGNGTTRVAVYVEPDFGAPSAAPGSATEPPAATPGAPALAILGAVGALALLRRR